MNNTQRELEARGGILALTAVLRRQMKRDIIQARKLESEHPRLRSIYERERIELQAALAFIVELEPHATQLGKLLTQLTDVFLCGGCGGTLASCVASKVKCCPDCTHGTHVRAAE